MKKVFYVIIAICLSVNAIAQESQSVFNYLNIPVSAHAAALGGDNISIVEDDASLALSNPALLNNVTHKTVSLGYMNYMSGTSMFSANYTHVLNDKATVGGAARYLSYGSMTERDAYGNESGSFTPSDLALEGLLSYTLAKNLTGGIGAKFLYSKIGQYSSTAVAVDLGVNYYSEDKGFSASFAVKNLGGQLSAYDDDYEHLPIDVALGASYQIKNSPFRVSLTLTDLGHWDYSLIRHACIGLEAKVIKQLYIAAGYNLRRQHSMQIYSRADDDDSSHGAGLSIGGGLLLDRFKLHVSYGKYHVSSSSLMFNAAYSL